ncbi:MAG: DUF421 domain-containing protein [Burkholderiales bacterium]|nr:DUF421 domain-containing protein [Burkholderiales bacterium]
MESIIRGAVVFIFLLLIFRLSGNRTLAQMTSFDLVLLLIISETTQQALIGEDQSMTNAALLIVTLVGISIILSLLKERMPRLEKWLDGTPMIIVENGKPLKDRMDKARIDEADILEAAREMQGLERIDQIKYAVLERGGGITVVPIDKKA